MRLRTALTAALLTLAATSAAEAQQPQGTPQGQGVRRMAPMAQVDMMLDSIALTAEQTAAVDALKKKYEPQMLELRQQMMDARQNGGDMAAFRTKSQELNGKVEADLRALLTREQLVTLDRNKEAMEARRREMQQRGPGGGRPPRG